MGYAAHECETQRQWMTRRTGEETTTAPSLFVTSVSQTSFWLRAFSLAQPSWRAALISWPASRFSSSRLSSMPEVVLPGLLVLSSLPALLREQKCWPSAQMPDQRVQRVKPLACVRDAWAAALLHRRWPRQPQLPSWLPDRDAREAEGVAAQAVYMVPDTSRSHCGCAAFHP